MIKLLRQGFLAAAVLFVFSGASHATDVSLQSLRANQEIETQDAQLKINMSSQQSLAPGTYTFELVVVDNSGNTSKPTRARVVVRDNNPPTAVLKVPQSIDVGKTIILDASQSSDIGGTINRYIWRLVN